jgi:hypothetical protein
MKIKTHRLLELLAIIGLIDSLYLTFSGTHFLYFDNLCSNSCGQNLTIFGIHVSVYGIIYYTFLFCFGHFKKFIYAIALSAIGTFISCCFLYYQIAIIHGVCIFCLISLVCTVLYFTITCLVLHREKDPYE